MRHAVYIDTQSCSAVKRKRCSATPLSVHVRKNNNKTPSCSGDILADVRRRSVCEGTYTMRTMMRESKRDCGGRVIGIVGEGNASVIMAHNTENILAFIFTLILCANFNNFSAKTLYLYAQSLCTHVFMFGPQGRPLQVSRCEFRQS